MPGGTTGGRAALVVLDLDLGTKASGIAGCTEAALETAGVGVGVAIKWCTGGAPGGGDRKSVV